MPEGTISFAMGRFAWTGVITEIERRAAAVEVEVLETVERKRLLRTDVEIHVRGSADALAELGDAARALVGGVRTSTVDQALFW